MKSATKLLCQKTVSSKVVVQSFPYLSVHRLQRETYPFNLKLRFEVEQASRGLSAIAELLVSSGDLELSPMTLMFERGLSRIPFAEYKFADPANPVLTWIH